MEYSDQRPAAPQHSTTEVATKKQGVCPEEWLPALVTAGSVASDGALALPAPSAFPTPVVDIKAHSKEGYLARVELEFDNVSPEAIWAILSHPDNSGVFRDIKRVKERSLLQEPSPGLRVMRVAQVGEATLMWRRTEFITELQVEEDTRDPSRFRQSFRLVHSDLLARFHGEWTLERRPPAAAPSPLAAFLPAGAGGRGLSGCKVVLTQDVQPKYVPKFANRMPVVGGMVRGTVEKAVRRIVDDMCEVAREIQVSGDAHVDAVMATIRARRAAAGEWRPVHQV